MTPVIVALVVTVVVAVVTIGKSSFVSHTKHIAEATNMDLFHS